MKYLILGDIHGRIIWKDIVSKEDFDKVIFLGDYVSTHEDISAKQQISNLLDILKYKYNNPDKVILLRGNHEMQHLGYSWAECSGYNSEIGNYMSESVFKERLLDLTQWCYIDDDLKIIFSHAGVSQVWLNDSGIEDVHNINSYEPSQLFGFTPDNYFDNCGYSKTQPLTWIRPESLCMCNVLGYTQVVGHTPCKKIIEVNKSTKGNQSIWLCDTLGYGEYLVIDDGEFNVKKFK
jgi:hypothetical protein